MSVDSVKAQRKRLSLHFGVVYPPEAVDQVEYWLCDYWLWPGAPQDGPELSVVSPRDGTCELSASFPRALCAIAALPLLDCAAQLYAGVHRPGPVTALWRVDYDAVRLHMVGR